MLQAVPHPDLAIAELARVTKPGGWIVVTTPNQLSFLSLLSLLTKGVFVAFQEGDYPAHRTALLESDLARTASAAGLESIGIAYSLRGRMPLVAAHYPTALARLFPRALSDNLMVIGRRPRG